MAQAHVEILQDAIEQLRNNPRDFICHLVTGVYRYFPKYKNNFYGKQIEAKVQEMLYLNSTYEGWLCKYHGELFMKMKQKDFAEGRIQWMQWMIENHHIFDNVKVK